MYRPFRWCAPQALVLALAGCSGASARPDVAHTTGATATVETMSLPYATVPPIDAEVPAGLQTATFALG